MEITPDIVEVKALEQYQIYLKFSNGEEKIYDMKENIEKIKYFNKLKNRKYFENVKPSGDTVEWENEKIVLAPKNVKDVKNTWYELTKEYQEQKNELIQKRLKKIRN